MTIFLLKPVRHRLPGGVLVHAHDGDAGPEVAAEKKNANQFGCLSPFISTPNLAIEKLITANRECFISEALQS